MTSTPTPETIEAIKEQSYHFDQLKTEVHKRVVGQSAIIERIIIGFLCNGHILLEGVPGLAKTTLIKAVADALGLSFSRIQFTPDLMPADLIGTLVYHPKTQEFETKKGPIFANIVLADEINRAPAKVQSALLEAMQERQVTIGQETFKLDAPFLVLATQNPIDQEGTYRLPEAQVDRFLFKLNVTYPTFEEEKEIVAAALTQKKLAKVFKKKDMAALHELRTQVYVDEKVVEYMLSIVFATREPAKYDLDEIKQYLEYGASPRATLALHAAGQAHAFMRRRHFVTPDDIKAIAADVLRHRIILSFEAEAEGVSADDVIEKILITIPAP